MNMLQQRLSNTLIRFVDSEKASGIMLLSCTILSLVLANSAIGASYLTVWQRSIGGLSLEHWVNDGLMTIFFSSSVWSWSASCTTGNWLRVKNALLPVCAAIGDEPYLR